MSELPILPYGRQEVTEEDIEQVADCLRGGWLTTGPRVAAFEAALCEATGARHATVVCNGTAALHLANLALGLGPGDVGVTAAVTFLASANALPLCGAEADFADCDPRTGLIDIASLEATVANLVARGRSPKVLIPVDLGGQPADLVEIRRIADGCGARVVQDAAHSLGATWDHDGRGFRAGDCAHADLAILSFHPVKHVTSAEGGAVLTNDPELHQRLQELRTHGMVHDPARCERPADDPFAGPWYYEMPALGHNFRLSDVHCALGLSQLKRLEHYVARRRELAAAYDVALTEAPFDGQLRPLQQLAGRQSAYHLYVVQLVPRDGEAPAALAERRKALYLHLREAGIYGQIHYIPVPWQPYYQARQLRPDARYPGAKAYYSASLSLPLFPAMDDGDQARVLAALGQWVTTQ